VFEHRTRPLASRRVFARRLASSSAIGAVFIGASLGAGMLGYHFIEGEA
jgi:hypothetical protein